jgi:hypothetical protein
MTTNTILTFIFYAIIYRNVVTMVVILIFAIIGVIAALTT